MTPMGLKNTWSVVIGWSQIPTSQNREPEVLDIVPNTTFRSYAPQGDPWMFFMVERNWSFFLQWNLWGIFWGEMVQDQME